MFLKACLSVLAILFSLPASAAELGFRGVGGQLGLTSTGSGSTLSIGAHVNLGEFSPKLDFRPSISYWSKSYGFFGQGLSVSVLRLNSDVQYRFEAHGKFQPYAGGGLALARYSFSDSDAGQVYNNSSGSVSDTRFQLNLLGGVEMPLTPDLDIFGELRIENTSSHLSVGLTMPLGH